MNKELEQQIRESLEKIANDPDAKQSLSASDWLGFCQSCLLLGVIDRLDQIYDRLDSVDSELISMNPRYK